MEGLKSGDSKFLGNSETTGNKKIIPYVRLIKDLTTNETTGVVVININEIILRSTYLHDFSVDSSSTMIVNRNGNILSHTNKQYIGGSIYDVLGPAAPDPKQNNIYFEIERYGQKMLVIQNTDNTFGWTYYSIVPLSEVLGGAVTINRVTIISMAISVSFCVFISYFLSKRVTKPIKNLSRVMKLVETGNLDVSYTVFHYDEIGQLGESFNKMISRLKTSMEESIQMQQIKMEAELKGLEFQINPHFLYNTLSSIIWLADEKRNEEVIKMTKALATFFRISISRGKDMITVQEEVEHVINYMEIQKLRYGDVKFVHDVDMEIKGYYTLKLLLQPIIENAIYHGVRTLKNECGIIKLSGYIDGNDIVLLVYDNGKNMTQERVDFINDALSNNKDGDFGVGLKNVNDRIKLHFGQKFGLTFSIVNEYTLVKIRIPIIESEAGFNVQPDGCR
jgi:two-component system sensor histidine kinase YesM